MDFVSVGPYCATRTFITDVGLRKEAYPFDIIFSSLDMVKHCIDTKFELFLDKQYYVRREHTFDKPSWFATKHTFYNKYLNTDILNEHHQRGGFPENYDVAENANVFVHFDLLEDNDRYEALKRRVDRFMKLLHSETPMILVYNNMYTAYHEDIIEFAKEMKKYKNVFVLGILSNLELEEKMVYESENSRVYQNYQPPYRIFQEVQKHLQKC